MPTNTRPFTILVSDDKMQVYLDSATWSEDLESLAKEVHTALKEYGVKPLPEATKILDILQKADRDGDRFGRTILMAGTEPVEPVNARLAWEGDFFSPGFAVDPNTGKIDYRRRAAQPEVKPDQVLARLNPARPGIDGADVFGRRIPVGVPVRHNIRSGRNVREEDSEGGLKIFHATIPGRVRWDMRVISVDDIFRVGGDVNMESGNIHHNGAVVVRGDVKSGFLIEADGDVEVQGTVEAANIVCGGNLQVNGGISSGRGNARIRAKGNVHAKYLLGAHIEAGGDVVVEKEIVNSVVMSQGEVIGRSAVIVGGETYAWSGVHIGATGNERGTASLVAAGVNPIVERRIAELTERLQSLQREFDRINQATEPMIPNIGRLGEIQRRAFTDLLTRSGECFQQIDALNVEIEELNARLQAEVTPLVRVEGDVNSETTVRLKASNLVLHNKMIGPIRFRLQGGEVRFQLEREEQ
jgi:uncharacterized protein (DUF342 family)